MAVGGRAAPPAGQQTAIRLAELIASLSLATDLGMGQPMEQALRTCLMAMGLARRIGCPEETLSEVYYLALVGHIGCTADAYETALYTGGDDLAFRRHASTMPTAPRSEVLPFMLRHFAADRPVPERARLMLGMLAKANQRFPALAAARCEVAVHLAERLGLGSGVRLGVTQTLERWDGKGGPAGLAGEAISLPARLVQFAHDVEIIERVGGRQAAEAAVRKRRGAGFDPSIADAFLRVGAELMGELPEGSAWETTLASEPEPPQTIPAGALDGVADTLADFVDLKSPYLHGHSSGVSRLAERAGQVLGRDLQDRTGLRQAGLLHDLGRTGIPNGIWQKRGPLSAGEFEHVRLHAYYTERILSRGALASVAALAGAHHERLDGSGYHRSSSAAQLAMPARILAAADVYQALTQARPHRPAFSADEAAREIGSEVAAGRLDGLAVNAVLEAAGQRRLARRHEWPAGLSEREVEVLRLLCQGKSNREMARTLSIAEKTVGHHVEHIYNKIGRSTRAGAALFAMEHDLVA